MYISDDANMETVVTQTSAAIREGARHVGKADRPITAGQVAELEIAILELQRMIDMKKILNDAHRS